jgi:hypothetical protein
MGALGATAATATIVAKTVFGNKRVILGYLTITCNGTTDTIPVGGFTLTPAQIGLRGIEVILFDGKSAVWSYNHSTEKVIAAGTGNGNGLLLNYNGGGIIPASSETIRFMAVGYGTK